MKKILTIAGSDSGGGAGIQADLKTITLLGEFGASAITALTAQNTRGVQGIHPIPVKFIEKQIDSVMNDIGADAIKTGMLVDHEIVTAVSRKIRFYQIEKVVIDPVMVSKSGESLLSPESRKTLISELFPLSYLVTPNLFEASILGEKEVVDLEGMKQSAHKIRKQGAKNVLIKGGHLAGKAIDLLLYEGQFFTYPADRIDTKHTHGTGCTYSAAIAVEIARGRPLPEAVKRAKDFVTAAIRFSPGLGGGRGPLNHYALVRREMDRYQIILDLKKAIQRIKNEKIGNLIPEVQSNLGFALPYAEKTEDIAAIPGRITRVLDGISVPFDPEFGVSGHISKIILTVLRHNPRYRSAMNIKYSPEIITRCKRSGFSVRSFDRKNEPDEIKEKEGTTLAWGVEEILGREESIPDIIYDRGDFGKEPMIRIVGLNPDDVINKMLQVAKGK